ncbi:MAG: NADH-ubiquinone oxidoreductase-F iron-sulfur binding region domain-containing protein [Planctomycetia bacterium]
MNQKVTKKFDTLLDKAKSIRDAKAFSEKILIQVGSATCEHAAGSLKVLDEFHKHIAASGREDIILHQTGCTGRCSREPIVGIFIPNKMPIKYEKVDRQMVHKIFTEHVMGGTPLLDYVLDGPIEKVHRFELLCCSGRNCGWSGEDSCADILKERLAAAGLSLEDVSVSDTGCFGACGTHGKTKDSHYILVRPDKVLYRVKSAEDIDRMITEHLQGGQIVEDMCISGKTVARKFFELYGDVAFFNRQNRIALRHNGVIDPTSISEYFHYRGFEALSKVLAGGDPKWVIDQVTEAKLRGRGGGGFPTGRKWVMGNEAPGPVKYLICNADEGDPGAFMDRSMLESDPFNVLEGMIIGGYAIGATQGYVYCRAEYPLAIERIENAIDHCRNWGLLGKNILDSGFDFDIEIRLGAGAFVCGEETALIHSIEGERGMPTIRPPYPTERGLWDKPTVINNVETFANITAIVNYGADWFSGIGTENSGGTKAFALAGKIKHTGLVEVPMGTTLRQIVYGIGGGVQGGKKLKAIQTGGPAGGCLPARYADTQVDYETLGKLGSIMGSGGMIILDEDDCMVDIAHYFMAFSQDESCGKCTPCREGTTRMLEILERITKGQGTLEDIDKLERLAMLVKKASLCGLGRAAPNPVLSTIREFRDEYLAHVEEQRCPAKKCKALVKYEILADKCIGCTACARKCPVECIEGNRKEPHVIDQSRCIRCGACYDVCRFEAVLKS